ncbi:MAG TPA: hypothetical protein EYG67_05600 [Campylobacterales bacterium]|nr:hypothetical protein [Campylobacterales bacterium]HIP41585.1 hypothetical protein [Campylobacterales bacterium]
MKGLDVLKKLLLLSSLPIILLAGELSDVLSADKSKLLEYKREQNSEQSHQLENSWINPIRIQYSKTYSSQYPRTIGLDQFVISVDQPIFKMGGIWSAMKYAVALGKANALEIEIQKQGMITQAYTLLYNLKKAQLQEQKLGFMIQNDELEIGIQKESYDAGLSNRTLYDQALLKRNQDITANLETQMSMVKLQNEFSLLSDENTEAFELPHFTLIQQADYEVGQLELQRDRFRIEEKRYNYRMIWTKYLPELSITGRYVDEDLNPMFVGGNLNRQYYTYGFRVSLPISITAKNDINSNKIIYLESKINFDEQKKKVINSYKLVKKKLEIIDKKIALSKEDATHYESMLITTQELEAIGDKTNYDTQIIANTLKVRELDQSIYAIDAQLELLELYSKVSGAI